MAEQIASLFVAIGANLAGLNQGLMQAQSKMKSVGSRMAGIGRALSMAVTAPLIGIGVASVKMAANFEQQMGLAQLALRDTGVSMDTVEDYADKMGASTIYNALEMASAITGLGKAGLDWAEIAGDMSGETGVLAAVTSLATASDLELAQAADVVAVAMATFNRPAGDAVDIVDNLVKAADASVASVGDLAGGLASAGPVMAGFGWSLEDVNTALALLSERGITGSEAGTALRSMMTNLMRPTDQVKDALAALNVNLYDSEGHLKTLPVLVGELSEALTVGTTRTSQMSSMSKEQKEELKRLQKQHDSVRRGIADYERGIKGATWSEKRRGERVAELREQLVNLDRVMAPLIASSKEYTTVTQEMTEEQRNELIQTLAGTYGMRAMNTLVSEGLAGWEEMEEKIGNAATAEEVAAIFTESLLGKLEELQGGVETLSKNFGKVLSPVIQELVEQRLIPLVDVLGELDEEQMAGLAKLGLILAGIGPALIAISVLPKLLGALISPLGLGAIAVGLFGGALFLAGDEGVKFRSALRGLSGDLKEKEGLTELGEWIDRFVDLLDALSRLGHWIEVTGDKVAAWFGKAQPWLGRMIKQEPTVAAVPGMPTTEETWAAYVKEPEIIKGWQEFYPAWLREAFTTGLEFIVDLVTPEEAQVFADEAAFQAYIDQMAVDLPVSVQPDMGQIEESGRSAGRIWKRGFDEGAGDIGAGLLGVNILAEMQAGGME